MQLWHIPAAPMLRPGSGAAAGRPMSRDGQELSDLGGQELSDLRNHTDLGDRIKQPWSATICRPVRTRKQLGLVDCFGLH